MEERQLLAVAIDDAVTTFEDTSVGGSLTVESFETDVAGAAAFDATYSALDATGNVSVSNGILNLGNSESVSLGNIAGSYTLSLGVGKVTPGGNSNVSITIGDNNIVYHPGYTPLPGAFRVTGTGGFGNQNMGFVPAANTLHHMEIKVNATNGRFDIKVTDALNPSNVYTATFTNPASVGGLVRLNGGPDGNIFGNISAPGVADNASLTGAPVNVVSVDGNAASVGTPVTSAAGAEITVHADGTYNYDPNGAFSSLSTGDTVTDSFTYSVSDDYALDLDGVNDYITLPSVNGVRAVSAWVNIDPSETPSAGWAYLLDARTGRADGYFTNKAIGGGWNRLVVDGSNATVAWNSIPRDGNWHHVYMEANAAFNDDITLGARYSTGDRLNAQLDEVAIWNRTFTDSEIAGMMNASLDPANSGLLAYYPFNDGPGSSVLSDATGNANHGTLVNVDVNSDWIQGGTPIAVDATDTANVTVTIRGEDDLPETVNDASTTLENVSYTGSVLAETFDTDLTGEAAFDATYPDMDATGSVSVSAGILRPASGSSVSLGNISGSYTLSLDFGKVVGGGSGNASIAIGGNTLVYHPGFTGVPGAFRVEGTGGFGNRNMGFVPAANTLHHLDVKVYADTGRFDITLTDALNSSNVFTASFTNPASVGGEVRLNGGSAGSIFDNVSAPGINDFDPDGTKLTVVAVAGESSDVGAASTLPSGAEVTVNADGTYTYDPNGAYDFVAVGETATDTFSYTVTDDYALDFDGSDDYVTLPSVAGVRSISAWVNIDPSETPSANWAYLLDARVGNGTGYFTNREIGSGWNRLVVDGSATPVAWNSIPRDGNWHHIYMEANAAFTDNITLGARFNNIDRLNAQMDEIAIWDRTFTDAEVAGMMNTPHGPDTGGLLAYYPFNDGPGSRVLSDASGNQKDGALVNFDTNTAWITSGPAALNSDVSTADVTVTIQGENDEPTAVDDTGTTLEESTLSGSVFPEGFDSEVSGEAAFDSAYPALDARGNVSVTGGILSPDPGVPVALGTISGSYKLSLDLGKVIGGGDHNVSITIGQNNLLFHPGYTLIPGAFRVGGPGGFGNQNMGFVPAANTLHHMEVDVNASTGQFDITITDGLNPGNVFTTSFTNPGSIGGEVRLNGGPGTNIFDNVSAPGVDDSDPDGDELNVIAVEGDSAAVGVATTLASGAEVTVNTDGTYTYDPNGAFNSLSEGATDTDSFTYTISDDYALNLDGANDYIQLPSVGNVRSLSMWVNIDPSESPSADWAYLLDARNGLGSGYFANKGIGGDWTRLVVDGATVPVNWNNIPRDGDWHHVYMQTNSPFNDDINLGSRVSDSEPLNAQMDEVSLWDRTFTDAEITAMMNSQTPLDSNGLLAYYPFNDGPGSSTLSDTSGNGHDGTLQNIDVNNAWVTSGTVNAQTANVVVTITGENDEPTAVDDANAITEQDGAESNNTVTGNLISGTGSPNTTADSDPDSDDTLSVHSSDVTSFTGTYGTLTIDDGDGSYTYELGASAAQNTLLDSLNTGTTVNDIFANLTITDSNGGSDEASLTIAITGTTDNRAPVISQGDGPLTVTMSEDSSPTAFSAILDATDADGHALTWSVSSAASNGTANVSGTGSSPATFTYSPTANYHGTDSFTVEVTDGNTGNVGTDSITVNVTINQVNDPAVFTGDLSGEGVNITGTLTASDPIDGMSTPGYTVISQGSLGTAMIDDTTGEWSFAANTPIVLGNDSFTVQVTDDDNNTETQVISIEVTPVYVDTDGNLIAESDGFADRFIFSNAGGGRVHTRLNDRFYGPHAVTGRIIARGNGGNDRMTVSGNLNIDAEFYGGEGRDYLAGGTGDDLLDGGDDNDVILTGTGDNTALGGNGNDRLTGRSGADTLIGQHGNDVLIGSSGRDVLIGDDLADNMASGHDELSGGNGDDLLVGGPSNDILAGGFGNDVLIGGNGDDLLRGESNEDLLIAGNGNDIVYGDSGIDRLVDGTASAEADQDELLDLLVEWTGGLNGLDRPYTKAGTLQSDGDVDGLNGGTSGDAIMFGDEDGNPLNGGDVEF